jgi:D-glycero-D-manno-heptose 1,7-bisphosphate phosphatase
LDRDGVINRKAKEGDYVKTWEELEFLPLAKEAIIFLNESGLEAFVVSNQRGIALGKMTRKNVDEINARMQKELSPGKIAEAYICPHDYPDDCGCRKPKPGLLVKAAEEHGLDLSKCFMIGDSEQDVLAGRAAGCKTIIVGRKQGWGNKAKPDYFCANLLEAARLVVENTPRIRGR